MGVCHFDAYAHDAGVDTCLCARLARNFDESKWPIGPYGRCCFGCHFPGYGAVEVRLSDRAISRPSYLNLRGDKGMPSLRLKLHALPIFLSSDKSMYAIVTTQAARLTNVLIWHSTMEMTYAPLLDPHGRSM